MTAFKTAGFKTILLSVAIASALASQAGAAGLPTGGTLVVVPAHGEVVVPNDQAMVTLAVEEQDKDKVQAASRVNQKMGKGIAIVKQQDPAAVLKTVGYYTYPVYPDEPSAISSRPVPAKARVPIGWRIGQYLQVKTTNLAGLPKTVAAAQSMLTLNGITFGLTPASAKKLDEQLINATYRNLTERAASIAAAMGRPVADATLETVDFEGSGAYAQDGARAPVAMSMRMMKSAEADVAEPTFEPGETTLQMGLVGKVKFK